MAPKKIATDAANILILAQGDDGNYYAAGPAWKLPMDLVEVIDDYKPKSTDPVMLSPRALIMLLDEVAVTPPEWIAQNLIPKPKKIPTPPPRKKRGR